MPDDTRVWDGDHFTTQALKQLRDEREAQALTWLDGTLNEHNVSLQTKAALVVLVVPQEAFTLGIVHDLSGIHGVDPPFGYRDGSSKFDGEGYVATSQTRWGRVKVLHNGVVEGVAALNSYASGPDEVQVQPMLTDLENNAGAYLDVLHHVFHGSGGSWLTFTLANVSGLKMSVRPPKTVGPPFTGDSLRLPLLAVDMPTQNRLPDQVAHQIVESLRDIVGRAFGL